MMRAILLAIVLFLASVSTGCLERDRMSNEREKLEQRVKDLERAEECIQRLEEAYRKDNHDR